MSKCACGADAWAADANTASGFRCTACGEPQPVQPLGERLFESNPDKVEPFGMRRSIHRSHRGEGWNDLD